MGSREIPLLFKESGDNQLFWLNLYLLVRREVKVILTIWVWVLQVDKDMVQENHQFEL